MAEPNLADRADEPIGWLTTVTPKGRPAPRPVWFVLDGDDIVLFSQPGAAKIRHIAANPEVSFHLNTDEHGGAFVVVNGKAYVEEGRASQAPGYLDKYGSHYAAVGFETPEAFDAEYSARVRVVPERSWGF
ncbi:TIGR03667 family PPOX class F420-dependent oxidoreductase [Amycolatopsis sp.]|uniref:TIGR03667 family PPOX class F420-dependent oxidoreductase n=1 Tax=Amycolatopsis sp. TaxID=37632 RepID=UPI002D800A54|nr:TIGR03667 family PPOX class F420-dependent oxidoreductase [Amycolatopsis sp.]HET6704273.1 TIGR03667 family PPOX class F420-dependent oxidoreductase [Amycolatopsis sp.]